MDPVLLDRYAALILDACIGTKPGDRLRIVGEHSHRAFMHTLARLAYDRGARQVRLEYVEAKLQRIFADHVKDEWVEDISGLVKGMGDIMVEEGWDYLRLCGEEDPHALEGADTDRLQRAGRARSKANRAYFEAQLSNRLRWCVAPFPTEGWARQIFGEAGRPLGPDPAADLMGVLAPIVHLDVEDPAAYVLAHAKELGARAKALDDLGVDELHFTGPGTDLRVGLSRQSTWVGGGSTTPDGRFFLPNHPTEEVFTSPDARRTEGRVACTRPVEVLGSRVEGAWFEFRQGRVVDAGAKVNAEALGRYLDTEANARRLGEVALVDSLGPIFASGLVFSDGLIDENAACHIALGAAYSEAFRGSEDLDAAGKEAAGFNEALVHTDFMIGSPEVEVRATTRSGQVLPILVGGRFRL